MSDWFNYNNPIGLNKTGYGACNGYTGDMEEFDKGQSPMTNLNNFCYARTDNYFSSNKSDVKNEFYYTMGHNFKW